MKITIIILAVVAIVFIIIQIFAMSAQRNIETYPYKVEQKFEDFEVRTYEASLFSSVQLPYKDYKQASGRGFSILAGYIFGGNERNEKIAMTSPVAMSLEDTMTVMFMVPKKYNKNNLPQPNQSQIKFVEEPQKRVAAIAFGGWASDEKIAEHKLKLERALELQGIQHKGKFYFLGYNPPYEIFNRRNEIIVELVEE